MNETIILLLNTLVYGFCFTAFVSSFLQIFKYEKLKEINTSFFEYSIKTIRVIAIVYFIYYTIYLTYYYISDDATLFNNRATGPYWFTYWMMLLRPFLFCLLIQLFWLPKFKRKSFLSFILVILIFFIVLVSGSNLERYVILITSFHRDYVPDGFNLSGFELAGFEVGWFQIILIGITMRILLFSCLVLLVRFIHKALKIKA